MMTLEEFIKELERKVKEFEQEWLDGIKTSPDTFPTQLPLEEWQEQFESYYHLEAELEAE